MITISKLKAAAAILVGLCLFGATTAALLQAAPRPTPAPPIAAKCGGCRPGRTGAARCHDHLQHHR